MRMSANITMESVSSTGIGLLNCRHQLVPKQLYEQASAHISTQTSKGYQNQLSLGDLMRKWPQARGHKNVSLVSLPALKD